VPAGGRGEADTLRNAVSSAGVLRARFLPIAALGAEWNFPNSAVDPWSPNGKFITLHGADGLYVFDITHPVEPPRRVLAQRTPYHAWSPDGRWLLCRTQSDEEWRRGLSSLVAVPVDSGESVTLVAKADIGLPFLWGSDGKIHFWYGDTGGRRDLDPPPTWRNQNPLPHPSRTTLLWVPQRGYSRGALRRFTPELHAEATTSGLARPSIELVWQEAAFPDGQRFLVNIHERGRSPYTAIVDLEGRVLRELGSSHYASDGLTGTSVSPDGRYVLGFRTSYAGEDIAAAPLYLADPGGAWIIPVDGGFNGLWPRFSPKDYVLAFEDPVTGYVYVGTLAISVR